MIEADLSNRVAPALEDLENVPLVPNKVTDSTPLLRRRSCPLPALCLGMESLSNAMRLASLIGDTALSQRLLLGSYPMADTFLPERHAGRFAHNVDLGDPCYQSLDPDLSSHDTLTADVSLNNMYGDL